MMSYTQFTPEMRKTHTILVPNMLPIHFQLLISIFGQYGYHMKLLESSSRTVVEEGLKTSTMTLVIRHCWSSDSLWKP